MTDKLDDAALAAIRSAHAADVAAFGALQPHAQVIHKHRAALLAEVERLTRIQQETLAEAMRQGSQLRADAAALRDELTNIASADWRKWHEEVRSADDFVTWAQSRARAALARDGGAS